MSFPKRRNYKRCTVYAVVKSKRLADLLDVLSDEACARVSDCARSSALGGVSTDASTNQRNPQLAQARRDGLDLGTVTDQHCQLATLSNEVQRRR
ncbi:MAG: hypothetical protein ACI9EB_001695 [Pseudomonas sp.]|jgi:hypothetical protein